MNDYFVPGLILGIFVMGAASLLIERWTLVNISDAELYRFCMVNAISLEKCKIPPAHVTNDSKGGQS